MRRLIEEAAGVLNVGSTGREILVLLSRSRRGLSVREIIEKTKRSERAIKAHLKHLHEMGLLKRMDFWTRNRRRAHKYSLPAPAEFLISVRREVHRQLKRLEEFVEG